MLAMMVKVCKAVSELAAAAMAVAKGVAMRRLCFNICSHDDQASAQSLVQTWPES